MPIVDNQIEQWSNSGTIKFALINTPYNIPLLGTLPFAQAHIDDIIIYSTSLINHYKYIKQLCLLNFIIPSTGHTVDPEKITNSQTWPIPTIIKQLQSLLGLANYHHLKLTRILNKFKILL